MTNPWGVGGKLAKYASEGVDIFLLTATHGDSGRFRRYRLDDHPLETCVLHASQLRRA